MKPKLIDKVEFSELFWKDLEKYRRSADYRKIQRRVAEMVGRGAAGEPIGDRGFSGAPYWEKIRHIHVTANLVIFTLYPADGVMRFCAIKDHSEFGFKGVKAAKERGLAEKILGDATDPAINSPGWSDMRWRNPADIVNHPELGELGMTGLQRLYEEIEAESDDLARMQRAIADVPENEHEAYSDAWIVALIEAMEAVQDRMLALGRAGPDLSIDYISNWSRQPSGMRP